MILTSIAIDAVKDLLQKKQGEICLNFESLFLHYLLLKF